MPQSKNPRSKLIDLELLKVKVGEEPPWEAIATAVIEAGRAPESKRKQVMSQAKTRHKWYTVEGKTNPSTPESERIIPGGIAAPRPAGSSKKVSHSKTKR